MLNSRLTGMTYFGVSAIIHHNFENINKKTCEVLPYIFQKLRKQVKSINNILIRKL
jgi:hypothetical protein